MTQAKGSIPARRRSAWSRAASDTGVVSASVTRRIFVYCGIAQPHERRDDAGPARWRALGRRVTICRWYEPVASSRSSVCPVGAVSRTTKLDARLARRFERTR